MPHSSLDRLNGLVLYPWCGEASNFSPAIPQTPVQVMRVTKSLIIVGSSTLKKGSLCGFNANFAHSARASSSRLHGDGHDVRVTVYKLRCTPPAISHRQCAHTVDSRYNGSLGIAENSIRYERSPRKI
jgi:hypothetical protein